MSPRLLVILFLCCYTAMAFAQSAPMGGLHRVDTLQRDTLLVAGRVRYFEPLGDVRLRRFRPSVFRLDTVPAGDTLQIVLVSVAEPLKRVALVFPDTTLKQMDAAVFKHRSTATQTRQPELRIKARLRLKRAIAKIDMRSISPAKVAVEYTLRELLVTPNGLEKPDTLLRYWRVGPEGRKALTAEQSVKRDSTGHVSRQKREISFVKHPAKPIALSPDGIQILPRIGSRVFRYTDFQPGDTLVFKVLAVGDKPLKRIVLSDEKSRYHREARETTDFSDRVVVGNEAFWALQVQDHLGLQKQRTSISVFRIPPARVDTVVQKSDTLWLTKKVPVYDTLAVLVKDDSLMLTSVLNIDSRPYAAMELTIQDTLPKGASLLYAVYWIGVNRPCINRYQQLEEKLPADLGFPGMPVALSAFGLGRPVVLPPAAVPEVTMIFNRGGSKQETSALWGISLKKNADTLSAAQLRETRLNKGNICRFYASFKNNGTVNTYPIQVKMIAFYRRKKGEITKTNVVRIK